MGSGVAAVTVRCRRVSWRYGLGAGNPEAGKVGQGQTEGREPSSEGGSPFESGRRCRQVWPGSHCLPQAPLPQPGQPQVIPSAVPWQALPEGPWCYGRGGATAYVLTQLQTALWPVLSRTEAFWPSRHLARSLHHLPSHQGPPTLVWPLYSGLHLRAPSPPVFL